MADLVIGAMTLSGGISITPPPPANDPYFSYTTLLLPGNGTNNAQNNTFLDSSTNNFTITRNGNTTQGTANPFGSTWSNYFNGNGNYLEAPSSSAFDFGTGDFTIECWVNLSWFSSSGTSSKLSTLVFGIGPNADGGGGTRYSFNVNYLGYLMWDNCPEGGGNQFQITATNNALSLNAWTHVAVTRVGAAMSFFVNGVQCTTSGSVTSGQTVNRTGVLRIGRLFTSGTYDWQTYGYISNLRIVKGTAVYTSNFTPSTSPLLPVSGAQLLTLQSAALVDNSANNFSMSSPGGSTNTRFSPFGNYATTPQSYSGYFDGSGDSLTIPSSTAFDFGSGDFTIEFWANRTGAGTGDRFLIQRGNGAAFLFRWNASGILQFYINSTLIVSYSYAFATTEWHQFAIVRSGNTFTIYIDGTSVATATTSITVNASAAAVSIGGYLTTSDYFNGCISNLRIVKGTAVYTTNFTPSTTPLTAISGTSLLTCQSTTFVDNSTNAFAITVNGNATPKEINPFGYTTSSSLSSWSAASFGGSSYFDGTGDYLSVPTSTALDFGTGDFTIECWVYFTALTSNRMLIERWTSGNAGGWQIYWRATGTSMTFLVGSATVLLQDPSAATITANQWYHIAVTRSGTTNRMFINGALVASATNSTSLSSSLPLTIGAQVSTGSNYFPGYITDVRIVKGTAVYTGPFVPPTAPLTAVANTSLLSSATNGAITDATMTADAETVGDAKISTAQSKFGGSSMYFDGTGDYLSVTANPGYNFASGNFTIEMWLYTASATTVQSLITHRASVAARGYVMGISTVSSQKISFLAGDTNTSAWEVTLTSTTSLTNNTWYHVAVTRSSNSFALWINGTSEATATSSVTISDDDTALLVGVNDSASNYFNGYIDDLRITKGIARYTTTFTPPTSAFPTS